MHPKYLKELIGNKVVKNLKQNMSFYKPMFVKTNYTAKFLIREIAPEKNRALVKTEIFDSNNELIIGGETMIKHPSIF